MLNLKLDLLQTLTLATVLYFVGLEIRRRIKWLERLSIPAAVIAGLLFALVVLITRDRWMTLQLDTVAQPVFNVAFFTTIGMSASLQLLKIGGLQVVLFLLMSTVFCFVQNGLGIAVASAFGQNPLLGVMAGSVTLVGGPATGMAFAPLFEGAGLTGAGTLALTAATFGIVCGGLTGGPLGTWLVHRFNLHARSTSKGELQKEVTDEPSTIVVDVDREDTSLIRNVIVLALAMGLGSIVSRYIQSFGITLPAYIGAMLVASVLRNIDDSTGWFQIDGKAMDFVGNFALNIFLVVALMDLKLWQLAGQALPLFAILAVQVVVVLAFAATISFLVMGRDYDSAVMSSGFVGFVLGTTANAVANMRAIVGRFGPAPRAFLVVPLVGAFFIDFTNAIIITLFVNWLR
ncbi:MAG TPA: sodium/glutamate symporter [Vicinamibacterales bacterium]|nr:sodium/glutamate symporter [Vicinamibacterales bacterium]